ncbi:DNA topoisomerase [Marinomonas sp. 15G1-11]|uniref:DNA topoisomerase n=1 Tax=Marinomonas phaeophyticola TaxID=3004091 RepID=A0ABT4JXU1_9GAMM|nr:DNA topoisomerase [Marinomonas sp. 15G1-11]
MDASKRFNLNAQQTLDICQQLYERHKLVTYPRSDCRYLPTGHLDDKSTVIQSIAKTSPNLSLAAKNANLSLRSKAWNDDKISAHHAIIPTSKSMDASRLTKNENGIYELIARQYLIQFYPNFEYAEKQINHDVSGGLFISKQKDTLHEGWKALFPVKNTLDKENEFSNTNLPNVLKGDQVQCLNGRLDEKTTSPPKHFTDATLLSAMTGIARYVTDSEIKKVLRETDGLGTEATRAGIIELLFKRQFLTKKGKEIHATTIGRQLVDSLPKQMVLPDMTAHWESQLEAISEKRISYHHFMTPLITGLSQLIHEVEQVSFSGMNGMGKKFTKRKKSTRNKTRSKNATN